MTTKINEYKVQHYNKVNLTWYELIKSIALNYIVYNTIT